MSARNKLANKQARRAEREARKAAFTPVVTSFAIPETKLVEDEETGEEKEVYEIVNVESKKWYNLPSRADKRGNRVRSRRGKGI